MQRSDSDSDSGSPSTNAADSDLEEQIWQQALTVIREEEVRRELFTVGNLSAPFADREDARRAFNLHRHDGLNHFAPDFMDSDSGKFYTITNGHVVFFLYHYTQGLFGYLPDSPNHQWFYCIAQPVERVDWHMINDAAILENLSVVV